MNQDSATAPGSGAPPHAENSRRRGGDAVKAPLPLLPLITFVLWTFCLAVGMGGGALHYPRPTIPGTSSDSVVAEIMNAEIAPTAAAMPDAAQPLQSPSPDAAPSSPPPMAAAAVAAAPPLTAVAVPSSAIAFAKPVEGPTRVVDAKEALSVRSAPAAANTDPAAASATSSPARLIFGQGDGRQPAPIYPREAKLAHQQGTVVVRLAVAQDGTVESAEAIQPCPSALLNQAAVRAVRETWQFSRGAKRLYDVAIQFQLKQPSNDGHP